MAGRWIPVALALIMLATAVAGAGSAPDVPGAGGLALAADGTWAGPVEFVPLTYVLVTEHANGHRTEAMVPLTTAEPVDASGDGEVDLLVRLDASGATGFRVGVTTAAPAPVPARVSVFISDATHPLVPAGDRILLGFDAREDGAPAAFALDATLVLPSGLMLSQRVEDAPGALTLLAARVPAEEAGVEAALTLDPAPPRFTATVADAGRAFSVQLTATDSGWPALVPDASASVRGGAGVAAAAGAVGAGAVAGAVDAAHESAPWVAPYWNEAWGPWVREAAPGTDVPRVPASGAEAAETAGLSSLGETLTTGSAAPEATLGAAANDVAEAEGPLGDERAALRELVREDLDVRPRLDARVLTQGSVIDVTLDALPERVDVTVADEGLRYVASEPVDVLAWRAEDATGVLEARVDGMPTNVTLAWTPEGDVSWNANARVPAITTRVVSASGDTLAATLLDVPREVTMTRDAATDAVTLDAPGVLGRLEALSTNGEELPAPAHGVHARLAGSTRAVAVGLSDVTHAAFTPADDGGTVRLVTTRVHDLTALVENDADVVDARITGTPLDVELAFTSDGAASVARLAASAPVPAVDVTATRGDASVGATLTGLPNGLTIRVDADAGGFSWTANGRTERVTLGVQDPGAAFTDVEAVLDDVPASMTLTLDDAAGFTLDAPGGIGRLTARAWAGAPVPVPANGVHYREDAPSRAVSVSLPGVRVLNAGMGADALDVRLATAGDYVFTALAERAGERVHVRVDRMPSDVRLTHAETTSGSRTSWTADARVSLLRVELTRGSDYTTVEFANVPHSMTLDQSGSGGSTSLSYAASGTGGRLEVWTNEGNRDSLWFRLKDPVPTSLSLSTAGDVYRFDSNTHVTVDLFDDRGRADNYLLIENVRLRKMHVGFDGGSTGWVKLDTDNHDMRGRVKNEDGGSGFELNVRGHLRAQNFELKWWNYVPYSTSGSISVSDTTLRIKSGGSWNTISL